jgi:hypothetical protein
MKKIRTKKGSVQNHLLQHAREIDWEYIRLKKFERLRDKITGLIL